MSAPSGWTCSLDALSVLSSGALHSRCSRVFLCIICVQHIARPGPGSSGWPCYSQCLVSPLPATVLWRVAAAGLPVPLVWCALGCHRHERLRCPCFNKLAWSLPALLPVLSQSPSDVQDAADCMWKLQGAVFLLPSVETTEVRGHCARKPVAGRIYCALHLSLPSAMFFYKYSAVSGAI